jgi:uncharacterized protein YebE (UPF0316 family)
MKGILDFIKLLPGPIQITVAAVIVGMSVTWALESRYMTVSDFTKSYVLDLKSLIRELNKDLADPELTDREREWIEEQIEVLMDDLCYENPNDLMCKEEVE